MASFGGDSAVGDPRTVKVMPIKALDANGKGNHTTIAAGITYAVEHNAKVIMLSFGSITPSFAGSSKTASLTVTP